jgi:hypothetical protein
MLVSRILRVPRYAVLCIVCGFMLHCQAQEYTEILHWVAPRSYMDDSIHMKAVCFEGAVFPDSDLRVPCFVKVLELTGSDEFTAKLTSTEYEPIPNEQLSLVPLEELARVDPQLKFNESQSGSTHLMEISLHPFRINGLTGLPERVTKFSYRVERISVNSSHRLKSGIGWKDKSVLSQGYWYKVKVNASGIYKLTFNKLLELGISNPSKVKVYGNGGASNPVLPGKRIADDLVEIPVSFEKGSDHIFNAGDYVLVYLQGPGSYYYDSNKGMLLHKINRFSESAYYFLTSNDEETKEVPLVAFKNDTPTHQETTYTATAWHEKELNNLLRSGSHWFGEPFDITTQLDFPFTFQDYVPGSNAKVLVGLAGRYSSSTSFSVGSGNSSLGTIITSEVNLNTSTGSYAIYNTGMFQFVPGSGSIPISLKYNKDGKPGAKGWLDFIDLNASCKIALSGIQLPFRNLTKIGAGEIAEITVSEADAGTRVWDVTDLNNPRQIPGELQGNLFTFRRSSDTIREYIAFNSAADFQLPITQGEDVGPVENQDLHGTGPADLVIITPATFLPYANEIAEIHRTHDGLRTVVATTDQIYNEFSSGAADVISYRDFLKMFYDKAGSTADKPRYLLLYGDGTYDNMDRNKDNPNYILTYQSENSLTMSASYVTDDFFGLLDDNESESSGSLDIGIGRFPVKDTSEARFMVEKVRSYLNPTNRDDWKNLICFIGDDGDYGTHTEQADELATFVENNYPSFIVDKIYLDAYQQQSSPSGQTYPGVNKAIYERVHQGALIINYTGHGNENGLAHERIVQTNDIIKWKNSDRLPLFVTATCEFSRFDDVGIEGSKFLDKTSAGEEILLNENGGGIGLLTTTRLVYAGPNFTLNEKFYQNVFVKDENGNKRRLGDILKFTKNSTGSGNVINKLNFTLLGDPAIELDYPDMVIKADSLDGRAIGEMNDTLQALRKVQVSGHFEDIEGNRLNDFNGKVYPVLFDKSTNVTTLNNDGEGAIQYTTFNNVLFRGIASVQNGDFSFSFVIPKDINYQVGSGKLAMYGVGGNLQAHGYSKDLLVGGISSVSSPDESGPDISLSLNDSNFIDGSITSPDPVIKAWVYDPGGINTTSSGIGHDIVAVLDDNTRFILNDYYQAAANDYRSGVISYPLSSLEPGPHQIRVKVWDVNNNSSEATINFNVTEQQELRIEKLMNYPNPVTNHTSFIFNHNTPGEDLLVSLKIYNLAGQLVVSMEQKINTEGYRSEPIEWDGCDSSGAGVTNGIYIYKLRLSGTGGQVAEKSEKLVILR